MKHATQTAPFDRPAGPAALRPAVPAVVYFGIAEAHREVTDTSLGHATRQLADWTRDYLSRPHPDLGRPGHVCPFTAQAARLDTIRIGASPLDGHDRAAIVDTMKAALQAFDAIASTRTGRQFRTVIVGFPNCVGADGHAALKAVQRALRHHSTLHGKMIGLFEPESQHKGLVNPAFRSQRAPVSALAIRMLVERMRLSSSAIRWRCRSIC